MRIPLPKIATLVACTLCLPAQTVPEGYAAQTQPLPANVTQVLALGGTQSGSTVAFDGTTLTLRGLGGQHTLLTFPASVFGAFLIQVDSTRVLLGESSGGGIWLVPLSGTPPLHPIATLAFNYDAVMLTPTLAIVSAKTSGYGGPDNDLFVVDLNLGTTQLLATIPGASGPVAIDGDLFYATASLAFPTPPGQTSILRFGRNVVLQAFTAHQVLGPQHAHVVFAGLDSASDIALDDDGDLFFVDWMQNVIGEIDDITGPTPARKDLVDYAAVTFGATGLQFVRSLDPGFFEPFQPPGGVLRIHESDFATTNQLRTIAALRADLTASVANPIPTGAFALQIDHGPANGIGLVAIALPGGHGVAMHRVPGFEQALFWHGGLLHPANTHFVTFDGHGNASLGLTNPGFVPVQAILTQGAFVDSTSTAIGSTPHLMLQLTH
ncbi:MAG: hypothetical protein KDC98_05710 [Planctomycetes bacterium]|nr:hypothetical protein [Planctomycetota bacterium]